MSVGSGTIETHRFQTTPVTVSYELDEAAARHRIGVVTLTNDLVVERDFANICPSEHVAVHVSRIPIDNLCTVETLAAMAPRLTDAAAMIVREADLGSLVYCCTSGTVVIGYDEVKRRLQAAHPGVPAVTPITAGLAALEKFKARKVAILTPYLDEVNTRIAECLEDNGLEPVALTSFRIANGDAMAWIPPQAIYEAALEADRPEADAVFISCTAIRAVDVVDRIEQKLGKPVVTANQALIWQALREAGYTDPIDGYGDLLRMAG